MASHLLTSKCLPVQEDSDNERESDLIATSRQIEVKQPKVQELKGRWKKLA